MAGLQLPDEADRLAVLKVKMRLWGMHPEWIEYAVCTSRTQDVESWFAIVERTAPMPWITRPRRKRPDQPEDDAR